MTENEFLKKLNQTADFVHDNWKGLLALGGLAVAVFLSSKYNDVKYTSKWFKNETDDELASGREEVRLQYIDCKNDGEVSVLYKLLRLFDAEMADRANSKHEIEHPYAQTIHREHGWYLSNDD